MCVFIEVTMSSFLLFIILTITITLMHTITINAITTNTVGTTIATMLQLSSLSLAIDTSFCWTIADGVTFTVLVVVTTTNDVDRTIITDVKDVDNVNDSEDAGVGLGLLHVPVLSTNMDDVDDMVPSSV